RQQGSSLTIPGRPDREPQWHPGNGMACRASFRARPSAATKLEPTNSAPARPTMIPGSAAARAGDPQSPGAAAAGPGSGRGETEPQPELAQYREEPQCRSAGSGGDEPDGYDGREHQEHAGRLSEHQHRQAGCEQQEDTRPQPGRPLEEAVQA